MGAKGKSPCRGSDRGSMHDSTARPCRACYVVVVVVLPLKRLRLGPEAPAADVRPCIGVLHPPDVPFDRPCAATLETPPLERILQLQDSPAGSILGGTRRPTGATLVRPGRRLEGIQQRSSAQGPVLFRRGAAVQSVLEYASQAARGDELSDPVPASNSLSRAWASRRNSASSCDEFKEPAK